MGTKMQALGKCFLCLLVVMACNADPNVEMEYAVNGGNLNGVKKALEMGANINRKGGGQQTPLMAATLGGHTEIVRYLLTKKPDATLGEQQGYTPMHGAGFQGRADIVPLLHAYGLDPSDRHEDGYTPIHRACWGDEPKHAETVRAFLSAGVAPDEKANDGSTPLQLAERTANQDTIKVLKAALQKKEL